MALHTTGADQKWRLLTQST